MIFNPESKVWIYQSNRPFNTSEISALNAKCSSFVETWTAHNQQLKAGFEIKYNRFIILVVDETLTGASGCSIDKSVHLMKEIEQDFQVNLFDRFHVAWKDGNEVKSVDKSEFEVLLANGIIHENTIVFNNLVKNYYEYLKNWETPFHNSWHTKVFTLKSF